MGAFVKAKPDGGRRTSTALLDARGERHGDRPAVIQQILEHLGLSTVAPSFRATRDPPAGLAADPRREWSYAALLDDLPIPDPVLV